MPRVAVKLYHKAVSVKFGEAYTTFKAFFRVEVARGEWFKGSDVEHLTSWRHFGRNKVVMDSLHCLISIKRSNDQLEIELEKENSG